MITTSQWAAHFRRSIPRMERELTVVVEAIAKFGGEVARRYIGHEQPSFSLAQPMPVYFPAWEPLAQSTIDDKTTLGFGPPDYQPLYRTGQMEQSISGAAVGLVGAVGSTDPVAVYHEFGAPQANLPPRPFLARAVAEIQPLLHRRIGMIAMKAMNPEH